MKTIEENSHFQFEWSDWFQGANQITEVTPNKIFMFNQTFEKITEEVFFKHNHTKDIKLNPKKFILFENCFVMELSCN